MFTKIWAAGDVNGDGNQDIFAEDAAGGLYLYPGNGKGGWGAYGKIGSGWNIFDTLVTIGDFDGDGHSDVLARQPNGALWLYPTNGAGGWKQNQSIGSGWQIFNWIG